MYIKQKVLLFFWLVFLTGCGSNQEENKSSDSMPMAPQAAQLMFTPQEEGVVIDMQNPIDFEDMTSLIIFTTDQKGRRVRHQDVAVADLFAGDHKLVGLTNGESYKFVFVAVHAVGQQALLVPIDFVWMDNEMDHSNGGIAIGRNTDQDALADMVDNDDDGDGIMDPEDNCQFVFNPDQRNTDGVDGGDLCDPDDDNDNITDAEDVDYDGDGLIEIASAEELDGIRFALNGSGKRLGAADDLNTTGCNDGACDGYELVKDIDLTAYIDSAYGEEGWLPLGNDPMSANCQEEGFSGIFEGNNFTISGLRIVRPGMDCMGLFGSLDGKIRNLNLVADEIEGNDRIGGLAGQGNSAEIAFSSATITYLTGDNNLGGLMGQGRSIDIVSTSVSVSLINGEDRIGGLIGEGRLINIVSTLVSVDSINGDDSLGGLIGLGNSISIISSSASVGSINGDVEIGGLTGNTSEIKVLSSFATFDLIRGEGSRLGGLIGYGFSININDSYALFGLLSGDNQVGGLVGDGDKSRIRSSYVLADLIIGYDQVGGLLGDGGASVINASYSHISVIRGDDETGGLIGDGGKAVINSSYTVARLIEGYEEVGGLIGDGDAAQITSSAAIANTIHSFDDTGGLIGDGDTARITSSYAIAGSLNGEIVGGLLGRGASSNIVSSYSVVGMLDGQDNQGSLIGEGDFAAIRSSYAVSSLRANAFYSLIGSGREVDETFSYWDSDIGGFNDLGIGRPQSSAELTQPTDYDGIYANWTIGIDNNSIKPERFWCDEDLSGKIEEGEKRDDNRIWDFGSTEDYPAIRCGLLNVKDQRTWWFIDEANGLQLNQTRLDELLP